MFNINLRSRSAEFIYKPLLTLSIFSISPRSISDVLNYLLGLPSLFNINLRSRSDEQNYFHGCSQYVNINLRSRSAEQIYTPLLTLSIINNNLRSRSEEQNYLHGCSQYVQYQPTFKIWRTKLFTRLLSVCAISTYVQDLRN